MSLQVGDSIVVLSDLQNGDYRINCGGKHGYIKCIEPLQVWVYGIGLLNIQEDNIRPRGKL